MRGRCPDRCRGCGRQGSQRPGFGVFPARASTVAEINGPARSGGGWAPPGSDCAPACGLGPLGRGRPPPMPSFCRTSGLVQKHPCRMAASGGGDPGTATWPRGGWRRCRARAEGALGGPARSLVCCCPPARAGRRCARTPPPGSRGSSAGCRPEALGRGRAPWGSVGPCPRRMLRALACPPRSAWACRQPSQGRGFREETGSQSAFWGPCRGPGRSKALDDLPRQSHGAARVRGRWGGALGPVFRTSRFSAQTVGVDRTHADAPLGAGMCDSRGPGSRPLCTAAVVPRVCPHRVLCTLLRPFPRRPTGSSPNGRDEPEA